MRLIKRSVFREGPCPSTVYIDVVQYRPQWKCVFLVLRRVRPEGGRAVIIIHLSTIFDIALVINDPFLFDAFLRGPWPSCAYCWQWWWWWWWYQTIRLEESFQMVVNLLNFIILTLLVDICLASRIGPSWAESRPVFDRIDWSKDPYLTMAIPTIDRARWGLSKTTIIAFIGQLKGKIWRKIRIIIKLYTIQPSL